MLPYLADDPDNSMRGEDNSMRYLEGETVLYPRNDDNFTRTHQRGAGNKSILTKKK